jgi:hypothetical protein
MVYPCFVLLCLEENEIQKKREDLRTRQIKATRFLSLSPTMPSLAVRFDSHGSNKARERGRVFPFVERRELDAKHERESGRVSSDLLISDDEHTQHNNNMKLHRLMH